jgi:hypothetical protein
VDDGRVDDRAVPDLHASAREVGVDRLEDALAEPVPFEQMAELADRRLVRHALAIQVDADKPPHRPDVVQLLLDREIAQVEPVLQKVDALHALDADRRTAGPHARWIVPPHDSADALRRNDPVQLGEEARASREPGKARDRRTPFDPLVLHERTYHVKRALSKSEYP